VVRGKQMGVPFAEVGLLAAEPQVRRAFDLAPPKNPPDLKDRNSDPEESKGIREVAPVQAEEHNLPNLANDGHDLGHDASEFGHEETPSLAMPEKQSFDTSKDEEDPPIWRGGKNWGEL